MTTSACQASNETDEVAGDDIASVSVRLRAQVALTDVRVQKLKLQLEVGVGHGLPSILQGHSGRVDAWRAGLDAQRHVQVVDARCHVDAP